VARQAPSPVLFGVWVLRFIFCFQTPAEHPAKTPQNNVRVLKMATPFLGCLKSGSVKKEMNKKKASLL
jgi:hypothetical protein